VASAEAKAASAEAKAASAEAKAASAEASAASAKEAEKQERTRAQASDQARDQALQASIDGELENALKGKDVPQQLAPFSQSADLEEDDTPADSAVIHHAPKADLLLRAISADGTGLSRPTQCQVDSALQELRLLSLGPVGAPNIISFADILDVEKPDDDQDKTISIHWVPNRSTATEVSAASALCVKLLPGDEEAANLLVAALTIYDRAAPGDLLMTPESITPRTPPPGSSGGI